MNPPRWFWALLATCMVIVTLAVAIRLIGTVRYGRYEYHNDDSQVFVFDRATGQFCSVNNGNAVCVDAFRGKVTVVTLPFPK